MFEWMIGYPAGISCSLQMCLMHICDMYSGSLSVEGGVSIDNQ